MSSSKGERRLRLALHAYPRQIRLEQGEVVISLAGEMVEGGNSSVNREALGMLRGGLTQRAGSLAYAPWAEALSRVCLPIAVAMLALGFGVLAFWMEHELTWPGFAWLLVIASPLLTIIGLLTGRRLPLTIGATLICLLGVMQGNSLVPAVQHLQGDLDWRTGGISLPLLGCMFPAGLLLLSASFTRLRPRSRNTAIAVGAWVVVGAIAVRLVFPAYLNIGDFTVNGLGICAMTYGAATLLVFAVGTARRKRDPAGMLAGVLALATTLPIALLYGVSFMMLTDLLALALFVCSLVAACIALLRAARYTAN